MEILANVLSLFLLVFQAYGSCDGRIVHAKNPSDLAPMHKPFDSLRVPDYDTTFCSDKWNRCSGQDLRESRPADEEPSPWSEKYR